MTLYLLGDGCSTNRSLCFWIFRSSESPDQDRHSSQRLFRTLPEASSGSSAHSRHLHGLPRTRSADPGLRKRKLFIPQTSSHPVGHWAEGKMESHENVDPGSLFQRSEGRSSDQGVRCVLVRAKKKTSWDF